MNKRMIYLINTLASGNNHTLKSLALQCDVSIRTIRNDIKSINEFLFSHGYSSLQIEKDGYIRVHHDFSMCRKYLQTNDFYKYKLSKHERVAVASALLVAQNQYVTISQLADILYVSRTTLIKDLPEIRKYLNEMSLTLQSYPNKGLMIDGSEQDIRNAFLSMLLASTDDEVASLQNLIRQKLIIHHDYLPIIGSIITEVENENQIAFTDDSFKTLHNYLALMVERNKQNHYVDHSERIFAKEYQYAQDLLRYITKYCEIITTGDEINHLAYIIKNVFHYISKTNSDKDTVAIQVRTRKLIDDVAKELNMEIDKDYQLYENLSNHLISIYHHSFKTDPNNPILKDIQETQQTVIEAVEQHIGAIESFFERPLDSIEVTYIVIHFCAAMERFKTNRSKYDAILVCNAGIGTSQLIRAKLKNYYSLNIISVISSHEIQGLTPKSADLLISTIPIYEAPIDFICISPNLSEEDYILLGNKLAEMHSMNHLPVHLNEKEITAVAVTDLLRPIIFSMVAPNADEVFSVIKRAIRRYFNQTQSSQTELLSPYLHHLLSPGFIRLDVECKDWKDCIWQSSLPLLQNSYIEKSYITAMIENAEELGPYFVMLPGVAIPHAGLNDGCFKTGMSMIRLKSPVCFHAGSLDPIRYVITLSAVDQNKHLRALFHLLALLKDPSFVEKLDRVKTTEEANKLIETSEYRLNDY